MAKNARTSSDAEGDLRQVCQHAPCPCLAEQGRSFCSDHCAQAAASAEVAPADCGCHHPDCM